MESRGRAMRIVNMLEAKTQLSRLVKGIERGLETEVVIARNGRLGLAKGIVVAPESIDGANSLIADLFERG